MKRIFPVLFLCTLLILHCAKETDHNVPASVKEQLREFLDLDKEIIKAPPSLVSITSNLDLEFRDAVIPDHLSGTTLDQNPFVFEPHISGYAKWITAKMLRFIPDNKLPAGKEVKATLKGNIAFGEQKNVNDFQFRFKVAEQEIISLLGDFMAVEGEKNTAYYSGTITFAQDVELEQLEKDILFRGVEGKLNLTVKPGSKSNTVVITTPPLKRTQNGKSYLLSLPGRYTADNEKWNKDIYLPGIDVFRVIAHMDATESASQRPVYAFRFSDPVQKNTDLSGYISVRPSVAFKVNTRGKYLYIEGDFLAGKSYTVQIEKGFPSSYGTKLLRTYVNQINFTNQKPEIRWISDGVYLPTSNVYKLQFKSVNVAQAKIFVTEIYPQNIGFFIQRNAIKDLADPGNTRYYYRSSEYEDLSRVGEIIYRDTLRITEKKNIWINSELDLSSVLRLKSNSVFVVQMQFDMNDLTGRCVDDPNALQAGDLYYEDDDYYSNPCNSGYYYRYGRMSKMLISSDIGLTIKQASDGTHVFATNLLTARPLSNFNLLLYSYQNQLVSSRTTDENGHALFDTDGAYIFGRSDFGIALMKLNHQPWELNSFDTGGSRGGKKGTEVFIYTDRGVHRPGDKIHLSAIVRLNRKAPPEKQPVLLKVKNPKGQTVLNKRTSAGENGHIYFPIETRLSDPTGNWTAQLTIGDQVFTRVLKVETVKPNRLKIELDIPGNVKSDERYLTGTLTSKYLFGAPASGLRCKIRMRLTGRTFSAPKFQEFTFSSPLNTFNERNYNIYDGNLNESGIYALRYLLPDMSRAPGMIQGLLQTTVYERGGGFTEKNRGFQIYPFETFTGIKNIFDRNSAKLGEKYILPIVVVDHEGKPVPGHNLKVSVYVNKRYWWWDYDRRDRRDFRRMESTYLTGSKTYTSEKSPINHAFTVEDYGRHFIEVVDLTTGHEAGFFFYASRWGDTQMVEEGERNYLKISSDKNIYTVGDVATLNFETPEQGMAYLTLEQGSRIIYQEWKTVDPGRTQFSFPMTAEMIPNCYASISMVQPHEQSRNDLPIRLYGIKPLYIEDKSTRLLLSMEAPDEIKPKENFTVSITSGAPKTASFTLTIVDEGLLDLTAFKTPSPWDHFFQKIGLNIRTSDNYDEILGVLFPDIDKYFSIGGGEFAEEREKRLDQSQVKRFKPVVLFQEPIEIEPGQTLNSQFTMPNYVGSVRVMLVGASGHSYQSQEKAIAVKQALMVLPTIPRVARPGDIFDLPVSVFAMDSTVREATVTVNLSENLRMPNPGDKSIRFAKPGEQDTRFTIEVGNRVGADTLTVMARSGSETADNTVHLPITSPNPFYTEVTDTTALSEKPLVLVPRKFGLKGTNKATLAFSRLPDIQLDKRLNYLIRYPYGCIEQTTSSALPQLFLQGLLNLKNYQKQMVTDNINAAIRRLSRYEMSGGFSFWPVSNRHSPRYSEWGSCYAGHFLIMAKELGYFVPQELYNHWLNDAKRNAKKINRKNHRYQTYRLFLLALSGNSNMGAMNLVRENYLDELDALSRKFLQAAYYLSGQKDIASQISGSFSSRVLQYREMSGTYGSTLRDQAMITYLTLLMDQKQKVASLLQDLSKSFRERRWYSTQETAVTLLAFGTYYKTFPFSGGAVTFDVKMEGKTQSIELLKYQTQLELENMWGKEIQITNTHGDPLFVTLFTEGIPLDDRIKTEHNGILVKRMYYNESGQLITVDNRSQGDAFWVVYEVVSEHTNPIEEVALSSIFPSGWEIINPRMTETNPPAWIRNLNISSGTYMDIRDDRVNWFFDLQRGRKMTFAIKINPTFRGVYKLPPLVCEAMYSPEFFARMEAEKVIVK